MNQEKNIQTVVKNLPVKCEMLEGFLVCIVLMINCVKHQGRIIKV
jgi:hypothetical protein